MKHGNNPCTRGFTLAEIVVGSAVFLIVAIGVYGAYTSIFQLANANQARIVAVQLADEQFEILRNMPYDNVGEVSGIPRGTIPSTQTLTRGGITFSVDTVIRNVDLPFDGTVGSTTNKDLRPADNKLAEITVSCATCKFFTPVFVVGQIAPKNVEALSTNGSLTVQVFDASGNPVAGAAVHVENDATTTPIIIDDMTNSTGILQVIDVPPAVTSYSVSASKAGYSSDQTDAPSAGNPNPLKPYATIVAQQLSQISLSIDKLATLAFQSVTPLCQSVPNFHFDLTGAKQIGPAVPKYSQTVNTNSGGSLSLNSLEWDTYTVTPNDSAYYLAGVNPLNPISLNPDSTQSIQLIVIPKSPNNMLVTVKDSATSLPISDATVRLSGSGYDQTQITSQGYFNQTDWATGSGQDAFANPSKYWNDDGNVDTATSSGNVVLKQVFGSYNPIGWLESSTFDTGTSSNFHSLSWSPGSQPVPAGTDSLLMQFAANASSSDAWNFVGPDGTAGTFYSSPNSTVSAIHNGKEYARYKVYFSTQSSSVTPTLSNVSFTFTSGCVPPGQVVFTGLSPGTYDLNVSKSGFTTYDGSFTIGSGWVEQQVLLGP